MNAPESAPSEEDVRRFEFLAPMLDSALAEMREFSKKKQDGLVSSKKISILNRLLVDIKAIVKREESAAYLDILSDSELPQNSDAVLVLGQYRAAMDSFQKRNRRVVDYVSVWVTSEWIAEHGTEGLAESEDDH